MPWKHLWDQISTWIKTFTNSHRSWCHVCCHNVFNPWYFKFAGSEFWFRQQLDWVKILIKMHVLLWLWSKIKPSAEQKRCSLVVVLIISVKIYLDSRWLHVWASVSLNISEYGVEIIKFVTTTSSFNTNLSYCRFYPTVQLETVLRQVRATLILYMFILFLPKERNSYKRHRNWLN